MTMNRRTFFKVGSAVAGGLVLALDIRAQAKESASKRHAAQEAAFTPNAWVRILTCNTITLIVDKSEMGQGVMTALPMLIAEELDADWDALRIEQAPAAKAYINPALGLEATGGSSSVSSGYLPLRYAGASVRRMLLEAAHRKTGIAVKNMRTAQSHILLPTGRRLPYGSVADTAALLPIPKHPPLKRASHFTLIGRPIPRLDTPAKTRGQAVFGIDITRPGLLIAAVQHSPTLGGHLEGFDDRSALEIPGVLRVQRLGHGVAVIAQDTWTAQKGLVALRCRWKAGPHAHTSTASIREDYKNASHTEGAVAEIRGLPRATIDKARVIIAADYDIPFAAHATLEPMNCTAHIHDGLCEIWVPTQAQSGVQAIATRLTGFAHDHIIVHTTFLGGGFGRRLEQDFVLEAVLLAQSQPHPIKVFWSRSEDMTHDFYRPFSYHSLKGALDDEGYPIAWWQKIVSASLMRRMDPSAIHNGIDDTAVDGALAMAYQIPHIEIDYIERDTPVPVGFWRSVGHSYTAFVKESFLDELAYAGHKDPLSVRQRLLAHDLRLLRVLQAAADIAGWNLPLPHGQGRGLAVHPSFGSYVAQVAQVTIRSGRIHIDRIVCVCDCGLVVNPNTVTAQLEGSIAFGLQAALKGPITLEHGRIQQRNFDSYPLLRIDEMPDIDIHILPSLETPTGIGEPGVPPVAPAICNAIFSASGVRHRSLPISLDL